MSNFNSSSVASSASSSPSPLSFVNLDNEPEILRVVEKMELIKGVVHIHTQDGYISYLSPERVRAMDIRLNDVVRMWPGKNAILGVCLEKRGPNVLPFTDNVDIPNHTNSIIAMHNDLEKVLSILGFVTEAFDLAEEDGYTFTCGANQILNYLFGQIADVNERLEQFAFETALHRK